MTRIRFENINKTL